jgi:hypothetical protein
MTSADQPVVGMCKKCGKKVRAGRLGYDRDEQGQVSHKFECTNKNSASTPHLWEPGTSPGGMPSLICQHCGYVWKADKEKPRNSCTPK